MSIAADRHAAIDHDLGPGDEARFVGREKQRRMGGVAPVAHESRGNAIDTGFQQLLDIAPGALEVTAGLIYLALLTVLTLAKGLSVAIVAFGLIASAVCGLLGPLFVPFFIVPKLDFLFWGWFKAFLQYSFMPVVAYAYLIVFERFLYQVLTTYRKASRRTCICSTESK